MSEPAEPATTCVHRWVLEAPSGSLTTGVCRMCGEHRVFSDVAGHEWTLRRRRESHQA